MSDLIYAQESYKIIGACFNVYKTMGCGFLEAIYQECLEIEFEFQHIPFKAQDEIKLQYRGRKLKHGFKPDFFCYDKIIVEIKAVSHLIDDHRAQLINYLSATQVELGLLFNFGHYPKVEFERLILTKDRHRFYTKEDTEEMANIINSVK